jgi:hypothetical protein
MDGRRLAAVVVRGAERQNPAYRPTHPPRLADLHSQLVASSIVRSKSEHRINRVSRPVVGIGPQVAVGVQCLDSAGVTETRLNRLHALAMSDEQTCVVVAERVKAGPCRQSRRRDCRAPFVPERLPMQGPI